MSGRGVVESEIWRTEQLEAAERESDPSNPAVGDAWVRVDLNPSVDGAQALAELRIQGSDGILQVPLIDIQDQPSLGKDVYVGPRFYLGTYADSGLTGIGDTAFVPVTDQGGALGSPRVVTSAGVEYEAHDAVELSAIPDSPSNEWRGSETGKSDGQTVDPWDDAVGDLSLYGTGGPELNTGSLNGNDAVDFDGSGDAYTLDVASDITEPFTMLFALEIETLDEFDILWRQNGNNEQIRFDSSSINLNFDSNQDSGGSPTTGDHIITFAVDDQTADLRQDGSEIASVQSASGDVVIDSSDAPSFFADVSGSRRYMDCLTGRFALHQDTKLSGQALDEEEKRLENDLDMNVL